jgi:hypothetical protein
MKTTEEYLIADSRARIAALSRATNETTRDRIRKALMMNAGGRAPSSGPARTPINLEAATNSGRGQS